MHGLLHGLPLSAKERSLLLQLSDGKVCPQADPRSTRNKGRNGVANGGCADLRLLNDFVGTGDQRLGDGEPQHLRGFEIYHHLDLN